MNRAYLDWNATAPLRPEARAAMLQAMDIIGNPSSVHAEGRTAKGIVETARAQVAALAGCEPQEVVFTSGATEAAALALHRGLDVVYFSEAEHDCVYNRANGLAHSVYVYPREGGLHADDEFSYRSDEFDLTEGMFAIATANGETGVVEDVTRICGFAREAGAAFLTDAVQAVGKIPFDFRAVNADFALLSAHKIGGPKGVGALIVRNGVDVIDPPQGGGQEMGRRSGTENVIGIAGFGAAAKAASRDLQDGTWDRVENLRDNLEAALEDAVKETIFIGKGVARLPNTCCFATPGWKGETQVMQMDLAGFAVSAGSACSSGKVKESRVLRAMGYDPVTASSAIRVSLGPTTTETEVMGFARAWSDAHSRWKQRAA